MMIETRNPMDIEVAVMELLGRISDHALRVEIARRCLEETVRPWQKPKRRRSRKCHEKASWVAKACGPVACSQESGDGVHVETTSASVGIPEYSNS